MHLLPLLLCTYGALITSGLGHLIDAGLFVEIAIYCVFHKSVGCGGLLICPSDSRSRGLEFDSGINSAVTLQGLVKGIF